MTQRTAGADRAMGGASSGMAVDRGGQHGRGGRGSSEEEGRKAVVAVDRGGKAEMVPAGTAAVAFAGEGAGTEWGEGERVGGKVRGGAGERGQGQEGRVGGEGASEDEGGSGDEGGLREEGARYCPTSDWKVGLRLWNCWRTSRCWAGRTGRRAVGRGEARQPCSFQTEWGLSLLLSLLFVFGRLTCRRGLRLMALCRRPLFLTRGSFLFVFVSRS